MISKFRKGSTSTNGKDRALLDTVVSAIDTALCEAIYSYLELRYSICLQGRFLSIAGSHTCCMHLSANKPVS